MIRLYSLEKLRAAQKLAADVAAALEKKAEEFKEVPMPGYTHMQRAMPTTVGRWLNSYACGLRDALHPLAAAVTVLDQNPLGSAAGFGINGLQLDRERTARELGFARVQETPLYCGLR